MRREESGDGDLNDVAIGWVRVDDKHGHGLARKRLGPDLNGRRAAAAGRSGRPRRKAQVVLGANGAGGLVDRKLFVDALVARVRHLVGEKERKKERKKRQ